jgi:hypothetical protein
MEENKTVEFQDSRGRVWRPVVTARVIRDFEKVSGIGVFEAAFSAVQSVQDGGEITDADVLGMAKRLFGHIGNLTFLLYEACRTSSGSVVHVSTDGDFEQKVEEVGYDDFCDAIGKEQVEMALACAVSALFQFFPTFDEKAGGAKSSDPPEAGPGETSTK